MTSHDCCYLNAQRRPASFAWHREVKRDRLPIDVAALRLGEDFPAAGMGLRALAVMGA